MSALSMSRAEREGFLAGTHVAIVSIADDGRGPLALPVWYRYTPGGDIRFATGGTSRKKQLIERAGRATLCVQTETPPYLYVSVEGPTTIDTVDFEADTREMALRYLGPKLGAAYMTATYKNGQSEEVVVRLRPERWSTADFRKFSLG